MDYNRFVGQPNRCRNREYTYARRLAVIQETSYNCGFTLAAAPLVCFSSPKLFDQAGEPAEKGCGCSLDAQRSNIVSCDKARRFDLYYLDTTAHP